MSDSRVAPRKVGPPERAADTSASLARLRSDVRDYYSAKADRHGPTPRGVDWTCAATQELRFLELLKICDVSRPFSLDDIGCGYGALPAFISRHHPGADMDYLGIDLSERMIRLANQLWRGRPGIRFVLGSGSSRVAEYSVASGIFNVKLGHSKCAWERLIADTITAMSASSARGFAVNFMTPLPGDATSPAGLYRTLPGPWSEFCERRLGRSAEVTSGYGLREFTLSAR